LKDVLEGGLLPRNYDYQRLFPPIKIAKGWLASTCQPTPFWEYSPFKRLPYSNLFFGKAKGAISKVKPAVI
jgi:hypothetical protein